MAPSTSVIRTYPHFTLPCNPSPHSPILYLIFFGNSNQLLSPYHHEQNKKLKKYVHNYYKLREINTYLPQSILFIDCLERKIEIEQGAVLMIKFTKQGLWDSIFQKNKLETIELPPPPPLQPPTCWGLALLSTALWLYTPRRNEKLWQLYYLYKQSHCHCKIKFKCECMDSGFKKTKLIILLL